ncbi:hypothetical protein Arub01_59130 [Actinomadura rubrobrunea]|uniref:Uncharacterized protein n=1 Tax=Actinomadura rubrobrunea TaxID=115335 RepID=A0A9W6V0C1_9ACTN|nr:helix-turn-helix transcriptional regulator [Actinomadura rubrobrunea]GLW67670.1 hypothetical protein Arub01_59130 [Actinomadura rubrobrunea]
MRRALARLDLGAVLTVFRAAAGLTQEQMASLVPGWTKTKVTRIEAGARSTLYDIRELLTWADAVQMPREALLPMILGTPNVTLELQTPTPLEGSTLERRTFNGGLLAVTAGAMLPGQTQVPQQVGSSHVAYLKACVTELWARDWTVGGGALLRQAVLLFGHAKGMLDESEYPKSIERELLNVAANLGVCGSFIAYDASALSLARRLAHEAVFLADSAEDDLLSAHVCVTMALQSISLARASGQRGPAREGLRFLERAEHIAKHEPSPKLHALIHMRKATAYALLGDGAAARASITEARRELDRGPHPTDRPWFEFVTETEITGHEARVAADLQDISTAVKLYEQVAEDPNLAPRNRTFYEALYAAIRLQHGDATGAVEIGRRALAALEGPVTSARALNALRPVRQHVGDEEFEQRFDAVATTLTVK